MSIKEKAALEERFYQGAPSEAESAPVTKEVLGGPREGPELRTRWRTDESGSDALTVGISPDCSLLAVGYRDGSVRAFQAGQGARLWERPAPLADGAVACTALRFRPEGGSAHDTHNVALIARGPHVEALHVSSGQLLGRPIYEDGNEVNCLAVTQDGGRFATGGTDLSIRLYDEARAVRLAFPAPVDDRMSFFSTR